MLARLPIRTKLLTAVIVVIAIGAMLAFSGFQGVYAYRDVAGALSVRAAELPLTNSLLSEAAGLRHAFALIDRQPQQHALLQGASLTAQRAEFRERLHRLEIATAEYRRQLDEEADGGDLLSDRSLERRTVDSIESRIGRISQMNKSEDWALNALDVVEIRHELEQLNNEVHVLPTFLQQRLASFRDRVRGQYRTWIVLAWTSVILAIFMLVTMLALFRQLVMQPFRTLVAGCRAVARGEYDTRIDLGTGDEFAELAEAMNKMTGRFQQAYTELQTLCRDLDRQVQERTTEVIRSEQLASVGFLAAGVAHEINNPMAAIAWSAEALENRLYDTLQGSGPTTALSAEQITALRENLRRIQDEAFRCKSITDRLLDFSRSGEHQTGRVELAPLIEDVVALVSQLGQYRRRSIEFDCRESVVATANGQEIRQVVLNLLTNALESLDEDGVVKITLDSAGGDARVRVVDDGCGMTDEVLRNLFEPFFTRRRDGRGTGLGLCITYRIVQKHGGRITAYSEGVGKGSRLEVCFPQEPAQAEYETLGIEHGRIQAA